MVLETIPSHPILSHFCKPYIAYPREQRSKNRCCLLRSCLSREREVEVEVEVEVERLLQKDERLQIHFSVCCNLSLNNYKHKTEHKGFMIQHISKEQYSIIRIHGQNTTKLKLSRHHKRKVVFLLVDWSQIKDKAKC